MDLQQVRSSVRTLVGRVGVNEAQRCLLTSSKEQRLELIAAKILVDGVCDFSYLYPASMESFMQVNNSNEVIGIVKRMLNEEGVEKVIIKFSNERTRLINKKLEEAGFVTIIHGVKTVNVSYLERLALSMISNDDVLLATKVEEIQSVVKKLIMKDGIDRVTAGFYKDEREVLAQKLKQAGLMTDEGIVIIGSLYRLRDQTDC